jgi:hypothetical protein
LHAFAAKLLERRGGLVDWPEDAAVVRSRKNGDRVPKAGRRSGIAAQAHRVGPAIRDGSDVAPVGADSHGNARHAHATPRLVARTGNTRWIVSLLSTMPLR